MSNASEERDASAEWHDVPHDGTLASFASQSGLQADVLSQAEPGIMVLPINGVFPDIARENNLFAPTAKEILAAFQAQGLRAWLYDDSRERRALVLESADIVLPVLLFVGNLALNVGLNILASWIYERWSNGRQERPPTVRVEYAQVEASHALVRWRKVEGPADEVSSLLLREAEATSTAADSQRVPVSIDPLSRGSWGSQWTNREHVEAEIAMGTARALIQEAERAMDAQRREVAEGLYRRALTNMREAALWRPDSGFYRRRIHQVGRLIHDTFGCKLEWRDGQYWVSCPVMMSHNTMGSSIGGSGKEICSICGEDMQYCPHVRGRTYDGAVAHRHGGACNICGRTECEHVEGHSYDGVRAFAYVEDLVLDHIAFVERPGNPLCALGGYSLSKEDLLQTLPDDERAHVVYGETEIHCHHCGICDGS